MNKIRDRRESLGLTQQEAARRAGLSLATWCRVEGGGDEVAARASTVEAFEKVLKLSKGGLNELRAGREVSDSSTHRHDDEWVRQIAKSFNGFPLSPRQAYKIAIASSGMEDDSVSGWDDYLAGQLAVSELHLLNRLPDGVLFIVNAHWLNRFRALFVAIGDQICRGEVPHARCVAERVALWIAFQEARNCSEDIDDDIIDGNAACSAILPELPEFDEAWDAAEEALFVNLDFEFVWSNRFTQIIFGDSSRGDGQQTGLDRLHPFRWFERDMDPSLREKDTDPQDAQEDGRVALRRIFDAYFSRMGVDINASE